MKVSVCGETIFLFFYFSTASYGEKASVKDEELTDK